MSLLKIYLNDHLAASVGWLELANRCRANNEGSDLGTFLDELIAEIEQDKQTLEMIMDEMEAPQDPVKQAAAWMAEKIGRLKLNGQLTGYSDLSRLIELEGMALGIDGKISGWRSLAHIKANAEVLQGFDFDLLISRAQDQRSRLEEHRIAAAERAFASGDSVG